MEARGRKALKATVSKKDIDSSSPSLLSVSLISYVRAGRTFQNYLADLQFHEWRDLGPESPGILQARTLEWAAISVHVRESRPFPTPDTVQEGFSRLTYPDPPAHHTDSAGLFLPIPQRRKLRLRQMKRREV